MRRALRSGLLVGCVAMLLPGCASMRKSGGGQRSAEAAIRETDAAWSNATVERGLEGMMSYYTPDARVLVPNVAIARGTDEIRAALRPLFELPGVVLRWRATEIEASRCGELGYAVGTYELTMNDPSGKPVTDRGKFVEVWKRQADGSWKCAVDIFNSDSPAH